MGDRQCHRVASAARRIDESEIRDVGGRRQLEDAMRNATVDDFLADKGRNVGPELGVVFGQAGRRVPVHFPIDVGLPQGWIHLAGTGVGDQDARIALRAIVPLEGGPQLTLAGVGRGNRDQRAMRGQQRRPDRAQNFYIRIG